MRKLLVAILLLIAFPALAQKPPVDAVAGPTTSEQFGRLITNPFGSPSTGDRVLFATPGNNGVLVTNGTGVPSISTTLPSFSIAPSGFITFNGTTPSLSISNVTNNGSGLCRITVTGGTINAASGVTVVTSGIAGATGCNGTFTAKIITTTSADLLATTFGGSYTSGGSFVYNANGANGFQFGPSGMIMSYDDNANIAITSGHTGTPTGLVLYGNGTPIGPQDDLAFITLTGAGNTAGNEARIIWGSQYAAQRYVMNTVATGTGQNWPIVFGTSGADAFQVDVNGGAPGTTFHNYATLDNGAPLNWKNASGTPTGVMVVSPSTNNISIGDYNNNFGGSLALYTSGVARLSISSSGVASGTLASTVVNGQTCTLGNSCTVTAAATSITSGTTTATGFTNGHVVGVSGGTTTDFGVSGTGTTVALTAGPTFTGTVTTPAIAVNGTPNFTIGAIPAGSGFGSDGTVVAVRSNTGSVYLQTGGGATTMAQFDPTNGPFFPIMVNAATTSAVCYNTSTGKLTYDGTIGTCNTSAKWFKTIEGEVKSPLDAIDVLHAGVWKYDQKKGEPGQFDTRIHVGLYADDVEKMDKRCVGYKDGRLQNYDERCVIAYLAGAVKELKTEVDALRVRK